VDRADEVFTNLRANRTDLDPTRLDRTRQLMNAAVRDCLVTGYEPLTDSLALLDPDATSSQQQSEPVPRSS